MAERVPPKQKDRLKRLPMQLFAVGSLTLLVILFVFAYAAHVLNEKKREAEAYADQSVHAIITTWSEDELVKRCSPEMQATTTKGELDQVFTILRKLGKIQSYDGLDNDKIALNYHNGFSYQATFHAKATFQNGRVLVTILVVKHDLQWQISGFHVDPEPFL